MSLALNKVVLCLSMFWIWILAFSLLSSDRGLPEFEDACMMRWLRLSSRVVLITDIRL